MEGDNAEVRRVPFGKFALMFANVRTTDYSMQHVAVASFPDGAEPVLLFTDNKRVARSVRNMWCVARGRQGESDSASKPVT